MRQIKRIFVHCTAGPQTLTVQQIQAYWKNHNKWTNPGYHYIIKPNGEIVRLQPEEKASNGVAGYNSTSINVCYIGGVDKYGKPIDNRTEYLKESLIYILKDLKKRYPDAEILGHRDIWGPNPLNWKKMCPCFNVKDEYKDLFKPAVVPDEPISSTDDTSGQEEQQEPWTGPSIGPGEPPVTPEKPKETPVSLFIFIVKVLILLFLIILKRIKK